MANRMGCEVPHNEIPGENPHARGGFCHERQENVRSLLSAQLPRCHFPCQIWASNGLLLLRSGHLVFVAVLSALSVTLKVIRAYPDAGMSDRGMRVWLSATGIENRSSTTGWRRRLTFPDIVSHHRATNGGWTEAFGHRDAIIAKGYCTCTTTPAFTRICGKFPR